MGNLLQMLSGPSGTRIALVLMHSLWQATAFAVVVGVLLRGTAAHRTNFRYAVALAGLSLSLFAAMVTWSLLGLELNPSNPTATPGTFQSPQQVSQVSHADATSAIAPSGSRYPVGQRAETPSWAAPLFVGAWFVGVLIMLVRAGLSVLGARRLLCAENVVDRPFLELVERVSQSLGLWFPVRVLQLPSLPTPFVMGVLSPVLIVPASMLTGLSPDQQLAIVAHELAHIRRWDFFVNLCQLVVESLFFFNPAIWWMSRQVRVEREACCDAIAVRLTATPIDYAQILADWAEQARLGTPANGLVVAFAEPSESGTLVDRVGRVLRPARAPRLQVRWISLLTVVVAMGLALYCAGRGTDWAVAQVAKALTDQERIAAVTETKREIPDPVEEDFGPDQPVTVRGRVITEDGQNLEQPHLNIQSQRKGYSYGGTGTVEKDGRFSMSVPRGMISVAVFAKGYAPGLTTPRPGKGGETVDFGDVVVPRGHAAMLQFVDPEGKPVPAERVSAAPSTLISHPTVNESANAAGELELPHVIDVEYLISARAKGHQPIYRLPTWLSKEEPTRIVMTPARRVVGFVKDEQDRPVAGVEVWVTWENYTYPAVPSAGTSKGSGSIAHGFPGLQWATTDESGKFVFDQMSEGSTVNVLLMKDGRARGLWTDIAWNSETLNWTLQPEIRVTGKFTGELSLLGKDERYRSISYSVVRERTPVGTRQVIATHTKVQPDGTFELLNLVRGNLELSGANYRFHVDLKESVEGLEVPLRRPEDAKERNRRKIGLRFLHHGIPVQPGGTLQVKSHDPEGSDYSDQPVEVTSPELEIRASMKGTLSLSARKLIGFTFEESVDRYWNLEDVGDTLDLEVVPAGAVRVKVLEEDGQPIRFSRLSRSIRHGTRSSWGSTEIETNQNGDALISPVVLDSEVVVIAKVDRAWVSSEPVVIDSAHPQREVTITVPPRRSVGVRVVNPDVQPASEVPLELEASSSGKASASHGFGVVTRTDESGRATITGVSSNLEGYHVLTPSLGPWVAERYTIPSDGELTIQLKRGAVLEGTVLDEQGKPVKNVQVGASIEGKPGEHSVFYYSAEAKTGDDGKFRFSNLPDARFRLTAHGIDTGGESLVAQPEAHDLEIRGRVADWVRKSNP